MAKPKIGVIRPAKPSALAAYMPKEEADTSPVTPDSSNPVGRPKTLPDKTRSVTIRMSEEMHQALKMRDAE